MNMLVKDICHYNLDIENGRREGKDVIKLINARQALLADAKLNPKQIEGIDEDNNITLGTMIQMFEDTKPIPTYPDDAMLKAMEYFVAQLARIEGHDNPLTDKMLKELEDYSVDPKSFIGETDETDTDDLLDLDGESENGSNESV